MLRTDVNAATSLDRPSAERGASASFLYFCLIAITASATMSAARCSAQDVADAARQERTRKEEQQKKPKHIYTEEDLKRAQILLPVDREQVEARKAAAAPVTAEKSQDASDAESLPANAPLGDVARHFQRQKLSRAPVEARQFALPLVDTPMLASPKASLRPMPSPPTKRAALPIARSSPPLIIPFWPPVKRSPFSRPKFFLSAPPRIVDSKPAPSSHFAPRPAVSLGSGKTPAHTAPDPSSSNNVPMTPTKVNVMKVKHGDTLWKLARQSLGQGFRWRDVLEINPHLRDANHIEEGSQIYLPATVSSRTTTTLTVQQGDSLSKIARVHLGHASTWPCIAHANPGIGNPDLIYPGQILLLPGSCKP